MILVKDKNNQMILNDNVKSLRRRQLHVIKFKQLMQTEREKLVGKDTERTLTAIIIYFKKFYFFFHHAMVILNIVDCGKKFPHCVGGQFAY